ncbi:IS66 family insertion sequence element accessory protein TnpB [Limnoglobus roseus]|uniref:Transposase n=1 Tax=Limnoglobus roseus TaxID=2598579 RepID=A0A5C1ABG4_9BACT|nr:IS66 family insertion sequence element accessory protein TnpB [Limnoglobus roseus]QEL16719.1 IS66 family insertion sequence hypothetical protein [Limnoglobus roseus]
MLNLSAATIFLGLEPTDMRKSFETLAARVREHLHGDPLSGFWFVFRNKAGDRLKILYSDGDGFALWQKRLAKGAFEFPKVIGTATGVAITATNLALILGGVALNAKRRMRYAGHRSLTEDPLYALDIELVDAIAGNVPGFFSAEDEQFERDLATAACFYLSAGETLGEVPASAQRGRCQP